MTKNTQGSEWEKRFESEKRSWELYGPLGMGIAYPKLKQFIASERLALLQKVREIVGAIKTHGEITIKDNKAGLYPVVFLDDLLSAITKLEGEI